MVCPRVILTHCPGAKGGHCSGAPALVWAPTLISHSSVPTVRGSHSSRAKDSNRKWGQECWDSIRYAGLFASGCCKVCHRQTVQQGQRRGKRAGRLEGSPGSSPQLLCA